MKKTYFRENLLIHILVLIIAMIILTFYTLDEVKQVNDECFNYLEYRINQFLELSNLEGDADSEKPDLQRDFRRLNYGLYCGFRNLDEFSMGGEVYYDDAQKSGNLKLTNFLPIWTDKLHGVLLLTDFDLDDEYTRGSIQNALYDGFFLSDGTITFYNGYGEEKVFQIPKSDPVCGDLSPWDVEDIYRIEKSTLPISEEGLSFFDKVFHSTDGVSLSRSQKNVFTSYYIYDHDFHKMDDSFTFELKMTFVLHPFEIVFHRNILNYIEFFLVLIFSEIGMEIFLRYKNKRENLDNRMAKVLTKSSAQELKESIMVLNEKVADWEKANEAVRNEYSDQVIAEVDHMDEKIKRILGFRDLETDHIRQNAEVLNLYDLTQAIYFDLKPILKERRKKIVIKAETPDQCLMKANPEAMKIIIGNLMVKALRYTNERMEIHIKSDSVIHFVIEWDGRRISEKRSKKIWEDTKVTDQETLTILGINGVGFDMLGWMLKTNNAEYGCSSLQGSPRFWFRMLRVL